MKRVGLALVGLGNVGRRFIRLLIERDDMLREKYGLAFSVHCVVDSSGVAVSEEIPAGYQSVIWNTRNSFGTPVSAGIYFYQIQTKGFVKTRKMVLLK